MKNKIRKIIYILLGNLSCVSGKRVHVFVLCYHSFSNDNWRFSTNLSDFKRQILTLKKTHNFISIAEFESYVTTNKLTKKPSVLLTIDDGYRDIMEIRKFVNEQKIKPVIFLLSEKNRVNREELDNNKELLSLNDIRKLKKDGWFFGSHGATHSDFYKLSAKEAVNEISGSKKNLEKILKSKVNYFAFPKGRYTKEILEIVKKSKYKLAFSMDDGFISQETNKLTVPRIGIDGTHSFKEFQNLTSFYAILFRQTIKKHVPYLAI